MLWTSRTRLPSIPLRTCSCRRDITYINFTVIREDEVKSPLQVMNFITSQICTTSFVLHLEVPSFESHLTHQERNPPIPVILCSHS